MWPSLLSYSSLDDPACIVGCGKSNGLVASLKSEWITSLIQLEFILFQGENKTKSWYILTIGRLYRFIFVLRYKVKATTSIRDFKETELFSSEIPSPPLGMQGFLQICKETELFYSEILPFQTGIGCAYWILLSNKQWEWSKLWTLAAARRWCWVVLGSVARILQIWRPSSGIRWLVCYQKFGMGRMAMLGSHVMERGKLLKFWSSNLTSMFYPKNLAKPYQIHEHAKFWSLTKRV